MTTIGAKPVPRYIRNINAIAQQAGISVNVCVAPYDNSTNVRLWSEWKGNRDQLFSTALLTTAQRKPLFWDCTRTLILSSAGGHRDNACLSGEIRARDGHFEWDIDCGPITYGLEERDGAEIVVYADYTLYHGTQDELIGLGVEPKRLPTGPRAVKNHNVWDYDAEMNAMPKWTSRRQFDGSLIYCVESTSHRLERIRRDKVFRAQCHAERSAREGASAGTPPNPRPSLRLVVDNTV